MNLFLVVCGKTSYQCKITSSDSVNFPWFVPWKIGFKISENQDGIKWAKNFYKCKAWCKDIIHTFSYINDHDFITLETDLIVAEHWTAIKSIWPIKLIEKTDISLLAPSAHTIIFLQVHHTVERA
jgi:hypothetical protein